MSGTVLFSSRGDYPGDDALILQTLGRLDAIGLPYTGTVHDPAATIEACRSVEAALSCPIPKNLFLTNSQHTAFYLLVMPGDKPFKTKYLSKQIGSARLSFGNGDEMEALLGCAPGSASVFGVMNDPAGKVRLLLDRDLTDSPVLGFHPCRNTATLKIELRDLTERLLPALGVDPTWVDLPTE